MPPRLSFKPDASFFRKIAIGAVGARAVCTNLSDYGHAVVELENGSTDTKIWKDVKRKRVRIPDLVCTNCGMRVESRAKTKPELAMSHSATDAERAWDFGMVDDDLIAFPICHSTDEIDWSRGQLEDNQSYWQGRNHVKWQVEQYINYIRISEFRQVLHSKTATKGVIEGSETAIAWDTIFSTRHGTVEAIKQGKISVRRTSDRHLYTWRNTKNLPVRVTVGDPIMVAQILASQVSPLSPNELLCPQSLSPQHIPNLLHSPQRTQRFTGIKLARLRADAQYEQIIEKVTHHPDEDLYVKLEGAIYLSHVCNQSAQALLKPYLSHQDTQIQLEGVVALAETGTPEAVQMLADTLDHDKYPYFLRSAAAWALGRIGTEIAIKRLIQAFADVDQNIREEALEAIEMLEEPVLGHLFTGLIDSDQDIAAGAAEAMRRQGLLPPNMLRQILTEVQTDAQQLWAVWLLGNLPHEKEYVKLAIAELQNTSPETHYAIAVLWSFMESWIARHWELHPTTGAAFDE